MIPYSTSRQYLHLLPIAPGECLPSWLLRISARYCTNFRRFSATWLQDELRVTPGFDAFPAVSLLLKLGAIPSERLDYYITHHTLVGTTKLFYTQEEWANLIKSHGKTGKRLHKHRQTTKQTTWHLCPSCRAAEAGLGIVTWSRDHQMPGLRFCAKHREPLILQTVTRIPPLFAPSESDLSPDMRSTVDETTGLQEDHLTLGRDIADVLTSGLVCRSASRPLRDAVAKTLFGRPWSGNDAVWRKLERRFGARFLESIQIKNYHILQSLRGEFHPSFNGIVYLAALARASESSLPKLLSALDQEA